MKKSILLLVLPFLLYACKYETDPNNLLPWAEEMGAYIGEDVYNVGDSVLFIRNKSICSNFCVQRADKFISQACCQGFNSAVLGIHHDGQIDHISFNCEIANASDTIQLYIAKTRKMRPGVAIRINNDDSNLVVKDFSWDNDRNLTLQNIDFSQDTIVLSSCQGHLVTLSRGVGILQVQSADCNLWELAE